MNSHAHSTPRKVALVFGGSRGIGAAVVARLADDGYAVAFTYVSRADKAKELTDAIASRGGEALAIAADSADAAAIRRATGEAVERFGPLRVVVVNAGLLRLNPIDKVSVDELDRMLDVNVRGVYLAVQASVSEMLDGGRVITIGSNVAISTGISGGSVYQLTKGAVAAMVKGVALDLAPRRITVNNVQPGPIETDMTAGMGEMLSGMSPLRRVGRPEEVAGLVSYLAGDEAGYITGTSLTIDGGLTL